MTDSKEFEGDNEAAALDAAAAQLGVSAESLDYTLLDEGAAGAFGLAGRPAKIRVNLPTESAPQAEPDAPAYEDDRPAPRTGPAPEKAAEAEKVTRELVSRMGFDPIIEVSDEEETIKVSIKSADGDSSLEDVFKTSRPPVAAAIQFIVNKIVNRFPDDRKHITIDAPGPSRRQPAHSAARTADGEQAFDPDLVAAAELLAERALRIGKVITVHPMTAGDRRAVHQTLMGVDGIRTVSTGEGLYRKMHIVPASRDDRGRRPRSRRRGRG